MPFVCKLQYENLCKVAVELRCCTYVAWLQKTSVHDRSSLVVARLRLQHPRARKFNNLNLSALFQRKSSLALHSPDVFFWGI